VVAASHDHQLPLLQEARPEARNKFSISNMIRNIWNAKAALVMPIIILGGINGGIFTRPRPPSCRVERH
jgi:TRAP-type C4-dicarboxylate transport system permease large subunit